MKKTMIFSVLFTLCSLGAIAQYYNVEKLKSGVWRQTQYDETKEKRFLSFTDSIWTDTYYAFWKGEWISALSAHPYYLSKTIPQAFDFSKVGKGESGKYLVEWNDTTKELFVCEIIQLTDRLFKFKIDNGDVFIYIKEVFPVL